MVEVPETTGAVRRAKLQSFRRHQQTEDCTTLDANTYRSDSIAGDITAARRRNQAGGT